MKINEIFESIQGESSWAGLPTVFVRSFGCNLNCSYCDTSYATSGDDWKEETVEEISKKIMSYQNGIVEFTGGEPLLWKNEIIEIMKYLTAHDPDRVYHFLLETNGSIDITEFIKLADENKFRNYYFILDIKMPSSGMFSRMKVDNLNHLRGEDEVKFVCGTHEDFNVAKKFISELELNNALISPVFGKIEPKVLVERILNEKIRARFQLQLHKFIWEPTARGV